MAPKGIPKVELLSLIMVVSAVISGGTPAQTRATAPVLFRIVLPRAVMCVGDRHLEVEAELRNISAHPISLSPAGIRAQVSFTNRACSLEDSFRSNSISADPVPGWKSDKVVTLAPGASYRHAFKLELDRDFFPRGVYRVQIGYSAMFGRSREENLFVGSVESNEALFEIDDCEPSHAKKP